MKANKVFVFLGVLFLGALAYYFFLLRGGSDLVLIGTVDANQVIVSSKIAGRIERLLVDEGQTVKQGELIAQIESQDLMTERDAAKATVDSLRSQVQQTNQTYASTHGETDAQVKNAEAALEAARAALAESEANAKQQEQDTRRTVALANQGVASEQDRDRAQQALAALQARVQANQKQVTAAEATLRSMIARVNQAAAARSNIAVTTGQMQSAQAKLAEAEVRLDYTKVISPVSGTVSVRAAREGEVVSVGTPIVTVVDLNQTWVYAAIPETQSQAVKLDDVLTVRMPGGDKVQGKVIAKAAESDFATQRDVSRTKRDIRTVRLKLLIPNPRETWVPGMTAEVIIPKSALGKH